MRRAIDFVLIVLFLCAVGYGAYQLGHHVDRLSNQAASRDSELNQPTTAATSTNPHRSHRTPEIVAIALGGIVVLLVLTSLAKTLVRGRKRESWRAS